MRGSLPVVLAAAGVLAVACSSSGTTSSAKASASASSSSVSGPEHIAGSTINPAAVTMNVVATGPVAGHGSFKLPQTSDATLVKFTFTHGVLALNSFASRNKSFHLSSACHVTQVEDGTWTANTGQSTGAYHGAKGAGTFTVTSTGTLPKKNGKCVNGKNTQPMAGTAKIVVIVPGHLTLPK